MKRRSIHLEFAPIAFLAMHLGTIIVAAQPAPYLVRDIGNPGGIENSYPRGFTASPNGSYFVANTPLGAELWRTDESATQVFLVSDIVPGHGSSFSTGAAPNPDLIYHDGLIYFAASTPDTGVELWKSDGTSAGAALVKDIRPGPTSSSPIQFVIYDNRVYFLVADSGGTRIWTTDGTAAGTQPAVTTYSGAFLSGSRLTVAANSIFFWTVDANGRQQWRATDGTEAGTRTVTTLGSGAQVLPSNGSFVEYDGRFYFAARDAASGWELWASDGVANDATRVADLYPGTNSSSPTGLTVAGGKLFFVADSPGFGPQLWCISSVGAPPQRLTDSYSGSADVTSLVALGGYLLFENGDSLWRSDGTIVGTTSIKSGFTNARNFTPSSNLVYFTAITTAAGMEPWVTDGTPEGTHLVNDVRPGPTGSLDSAWIKLAPFGTGGLLFSANDGVSGAQLWYTNGSAPGTRLVANLSGPRINANPAQLVDAAGTVFFTAATEAAGRELWRSDGTEAGTALVLDALSGPGDPLAQSPGPSIIGWSGAKLLMTRDDATSTRQLWSSDGSDTGTQAIWPPAGSDNSYYDNGAFLGTDYVFFGSDSNSLLKLWITDGTAAGTRFVREPYPNVARSQLVRGATVFRSNGGLVYFALANPLQGGYALWRTDGTTAGTFAIASLQSNAVDPQSGTPWLFNGVSTAAGGELWRTDGTTAGTYLLRDIRPGTAYSNPGSFTKVGATTYFSANDGAGFAIWRTNGTTEGTLLAFTYASVTGASGALSLFGSAGDQLVLRGNNSSAESQLWGSDGTAAGTRPLTTVSGGLSNLTKVATTDSFLYFTALDAAHGTELWRTDGTAAGTMMLADIQPGAASSNPESVTVAGNRVYFTALSDQTGRELWTSNGWPDGTLLVADLNPGTASSSPESLTVSGDQLFFSATTPATGRELWAIRWRTSGDLNCDGQVNGFDIDSFVLALVDPGAYRVAETGCEPLNGDIDHSGTLTNFDIDPFVACITNLPPAGVACP